MVTKGIQNAKETKPLSFKTVSEKGTNNSGTRVGAI